MKIVIVGAGRMGKEIAFRLADEGHDITVVDDDEQNLETVSNSMDVMTLLGNGADYSVLSQAEVGDSDLLIAVTNDDAVNMLCCLTGKKLGVKNTIARVRTMERAQPGAGRGGGHLAHTALPQRCEGRLLCQGQSRDGRAYRGGELAALRSAP